MGTLTGTHGLFFVEELHNLIGMVAVGIKTPEATSANGSAIHRV
jgi:hypothetical protein